MEEKNKNEELKQQEMNEASSATRASYSTGTGMGPDDCMSQDFFNSLNDRGIITDIVYVCGWGWTIPGASASGCGCGCGSGSGSRPSCSCGCCNYDHCSCISSGSGCGCGSGCGSGGSSGCGSGCGSGSGGSHSCACSCYDCGAYGCGAGSGCGSGSTEDDNKKLEEARKPENVRKNEKVKKAIEDLWKAMTNNAADQKRREVGCYIYYRPADGQYYIGKTKEGEVVSKETTASVYLGPTSPRENDVPTDAICITSCHTHTALLDGAFEQEHEVGPSDSDRKEVNSSGQEGDFRIVLDYEGYREGDKFYIFPRGNIYGTPMIYIHYRDKDKVKKEDRVEKYFFYQ